MFFSNGTPCERCGEPISPGYESHHQCDKNRYVNYQMYRAAQGIESFENDYFLWQESSEGRFHAWLAARDVRNSLHHHEES